MANLSTTSRSLPRSMVEAGAVTLDHLASFRIIYVAIFAYVMLSVVSIEIAEGLLDRHFNEAIARAVRVDPADGAIAPQIEERVSAVVRDSAWTRIGGVRVSAFVLSADGRTPLYAGGRSIPPAVLSDPSAALEEAQRLLPAGADVVVSVPLDSLLAGATLVAYGVVLIQGLFLYYRGVARRDTALIDEAMRARETAAQRASSIEQELDDVRQRLGQLEPTERSQAEEIRSLDRERHALRRKLAELGEREAELRSTAARSTELDQERQALEELLEEAIDDLGQKDEEITGLRDRLKRASKTSSGGSRTRAAEQLARRLRTLYRNLEIDDRAIQDMVALRDETMKLKAEEALKRLADDPESAAIRRKVGGLPAQLSIFELGFAGKGRIYYTRGSQRHYRVLAVGAKNTQKTDLEYLSRLSL